MISVASWYRHARYYASILAWIVWHVKPSCWNHISSKSYSSIEGKNKSVIISDQNASNWRWQSFHRRFWKKKDPITVEDQRAHQTLTFSGGNDLSSVTWWFSEPLTQTIVFINTTTECEIRFIAEENFVRKIAGPRLLFKHLFHVSTTFWMVRWLQLLRELNFTAM